MALRKPADKISPVASESADASQGLPPQPEATGQLTETAVLQSIRLSIGKLPHVLIDRNNSGKLRTETGRWVEFGVFAPGAPDLIGFVIVNGNPIFCAIEVKRPGAHTAPALLAQQIQFINLIRSVHGLAGFAESVSDALDIIKGGNGCPPH